MIKKIRENITDNLNNYIKIIYNGSRNKKEEFFGIIKEVYNNVFIVELKTGEIRCFSYSDVLTNTIEIFFDKIL